MVTANIPTKIISSTPTSAMRSGQRQPDDQTAIETIHANISQPRFCGSALPTKTLTESSGCSIDQTTKTPQPAWQIGHIRCCQELKADRLSDVRTRLAVVRAVPILCRPSLVRSMSSAPLYLRSISAHVFQNVNQTQNQKRTNQDQHRTEAINSRQQQRTHRTGARG